MDGYPLSMLCPSMNVEETLFTLNVPPGLEEEIVLKVPLFLRKLFWASQPKQAAKITRQPMPPAAPAVLLHSLDTRQEASNIILAMTRRDVGKPAFSLRKKRFVKTHALSLLRTKNLRYAMLRFQDFQRLMLESEHDFCTFPIYSHDHRNKGRSLAEWSAAEESPFLDVCSGA